MPTLHLITRGDQQRIVPRVDVVVDYNHIHSQTQRLGVL